jgi:hypothetical protein
MSMLTSTDRAWRVATHAGSHAGTIVTAAVQMNCIEDVYLLDIYAEDSWRKNALLPHVDKDHGHSAMSSGQLGLVSRKEQLLWLPPSSRRRTAWPCCKGSGSIDISAPPQQEVRIGAPV